MIVLGRDKGYLYSMTYMDKKSFFFKLFFLYNSLY